LCDGGKAEGKGCRQEALHQHGGSNSAKDPVGPERWASPLDDATSMSLARCRAEIATAVIFALS
jgi:hypothetical protein